MLFTAALFPGVGVSHICATPCFNGVAVKTHTKGAAMSELGTDTETLKANLVTARTALHQLLTGKKTVKATYLDVGAVEYTPAQEANLRAYIRELAAAVGETTTRPRRAATPIF